MARRDTRDRETVDMRWDARPDGGLPCDLPVDGRGAGNGAGRRPGRWRLALAALCVALALVAVALAVSGHLGSTDEPGAVAESAAAGAGDLLTEAVQTGRDVQARAARGEGPVSGVVCIDAGHGGGYDLTLTPVGPGSSQMQYVEPGGTSGVVTGRDEAVVTLEVAQLLREKLQDAGVAVVMVREDNDTVMSSEQRAQVANECGADLFIRLHCDGSDDPSLTGFSTLVPGYNDWTADIVESSALAAQIMHPIIVETTGARDAGIVERYDLAGFNFCDVPSVLFEMGFMSNPDEDVLLSDPAYQDLLAEGICRATLAYLEAVSE